MSIKLIIADDHPIVLKGLWELLSEYEDIEVLASASSGSKLLEEMVSFKPDVLLLDIQLPDISGFELTKIIKDKYPETAILILTNITLPYQAKSILQMGASGFLLKSVHPELLVEAIKTVFEGKQFIDPEIRDKLLVEITSQNNTNPNLTLREKEILKLIAKEYTNPEIASQLYISPKTVENHRLNILFKLDVKNTAGLIRKAIQLGLIE